MPLQIPIKHPTENWAYLIRGIDYGYCMAKE